jgi:hypothetical protein
MFYLVGILPLIATEAFSGVEHPLVARPAESRRSPQKVGYVATSMELLGTDKAKSHHPG